jgi:hypothetical protein
VLFFRLAPPMAANSHKMMNGWRHIKGGSCASSASKDRSRHVESNASRFSRRICSLRGTFLRLAMKHALISIRCGTSVLLHLLIHGDDTVPGGITGLGIIDDFLHRLIRKERVHSWRISMKVCPFISILIA